MGGLILHSKLWLYRVDLARRNASLIIASPPKLWSDWRGVGQIRGQGAGIVTVQGQPACRRLWLFVREGVNLRLVANTWSDPQGRYAFEGLNPDKYFLVMAVDDGYHPIAYDRIQPYV